MKVAVQVDQKAKQVTYDYTVSGVFENAASQNRETAVGLCFPGAAADKSDCILMKQSLTYSPLAGGAISKITNTVNRRVDVTDALKVNANWAGQVIGLTDASIACGGATIKAETSASPWTTWTHTAPAAASNLCDELSMNKDKQGYKTADKTMTIQATVTVAASADEAKAVALLTAFKTAAATMQGGIQDADGTDTNAVVKLTYTEKATTTTGASAMTTFAVAIAAAAALF